VSAIVDPLAIDDIKPFGVLLADHAITKVFHAGSQDIAILYHATGIMPSPVFDTQVAAALLGYPLQVGYGPLVRSMCGVRLAKADSYTDWARRPLSDNQVKYALDDVAYLPQMYEHMKASLAKKGRLEWLDADFKELTNPAKYDNEPREMWRRVKRVSSLSRQQLAIAREIAAWREQEAVKRNVPRKWVLSDEAIIEITRKAPSTSGRLLEVRGLAGHLSRKGVNQILEAVRKGVEMPQEQWPKLERHARGNTEIDGAVDMMAALVDVRANQNDVAAPVLASHDELTRLARGHRSDVAVLEGWRYQMVGKELIDLLEGRISLYLDNGRIEVTVRNRS
jgi:ribonuclease D